MTEFTVSARAYTKIILHAAKYPHCAVNGILLAEKEQSERSKNLEIIDAIPLFHQCLFVTPMVEIALMQIDVLAEEKNVVIAGYYAAPENFYHNTIDKAPGIRIADKIAENYPNACLLLVDNKYVSPKTDRPALKAWHHAENRWAKAEYTLEQCDSTLEAVSALLSRGAMKDIVDFDNHLDNPDNDWTNEYLNRDLAKILAMY